MRRAIAVLAAACTTAVCNAGAAHAGGPLDLERIDTPNVTTTFVSCNPSGISTVHFVASGTAEGPYPGTYSSSGSFTIGPQTLPGGASNNFHDVGPLLSFDETYTIESGGTTISGTASLVDPPPGASISGATLNTGTCADVSGATLGSVTNATGTVIHAFATAAITADPVYAPAGTFAYTVFTRQMITSSSIGPFTAGEFAHNFRSPSPPPPGPSFVTRSGAQLLLDGSAFRPIGLNIYNANSNGWCWYQMDESVLGDSLTAIGPGKNAFRAWFFQPLATTNGVRDWTAFDRTLAVANARGYKVIATLIDQWGDCGVTTTPGYGYKDVNWYQSAYKQRDQGGTVSYREWVQEVAARYRNEPAVLAWQLVNEPEVMPFSGADCSTVPESTAAAVLKAFAADVSAAIKAADPNHLVSLGTIGSGQCGTQSEDYKEVMSIGALDLCEFHDYTPNQLLPGDQWNGLQVRLTQCGELSKPLLVGELGVKPSDVGGTLQARADTVASKLCAQFGAGVAGAFLWAWGKDGSLLDNFDIGPGDPVLDVLTPWSNPAYVCTDANQDGIADSLQPSGTPDGSFVDAAITPNTTGSLVAANGLVVTITDAPSPDGVEITVGAGTGSAQFSVCGGFTLRLAAGSTATITCGSVRVAVGSGSAEVVLGGGTSVVTIPSGGEATVTSTGSDSFAVENIGDTTVTLTVDGTSTSVGPNTPATTFRTWRFIGFESPIDNNGVLNVAKAGRAIPLRWRLLDATNQPVSTLTAVSVTVETLACGTGTTVDNVEEYAAGSSGLRNLGDGYYSFVWQTPTAYAGSCKSMKLNVGDGVAHRAHFKFTR